MKLKKNITNKLVKESIKHSTSNLKSVNKCHTVINKQFVYEAATGYCTYNTDLSDCIWLQLVHTVNPSMAPRQDQN
jgi:hypothetical protein